MIHHYTWCINTSHDGSSPFMRNHHLSRWTNTIRDASSLAMKDRHLSWWSTVRWSKLRAPWDNHVFDCPSKYIFKIAPKHLEPPNYISPSHFPRADFVWILIFRGWIFFAFAHWVEHMSELWAAESITSPPRERSAAWKQREKTHRSLKNRITWFSHSQVAWSWSLFVRHCVVMFLVSPLPKVSE